MKQGHYMTPAMHGIFSAFNWLKNRRLTENLPSQTQFTSDITSKVRIKRAGTNASFF